MPVFLIAQLAKPKRTSQSVYQPKQTPVDALLAVSSVFKPSIAEVEIQHLRKRRPDAGNIVFVILVVRDAVLIDQFCVMGASTSGIALSDSGTEQASDIGRMRRGRLIEVMIQVVARTVKETTDMQRFTAGR